MKDFLGKPLRIGDSVVFSEPRHKLLTKAIVVDYNTNNITLEYENCKTGNTKLSYICSPYSVIKIPT